MVRPSQLQIAEHCDLAPYLAEHYPRTSPEAERGKEVDRQVSQELTGGPPALDMDAVACVRWIRAHVREPRVQERVQLFDQETGALITEGTPDVVGYDAFGTLVVVDLKKREQWGAARLAHPDDNLQLHAYALASLRPGLSEYQTCALLFGDGTVEPIWSRTYTPPDWLPLLARIRKISARVMSDGGREPKGLSGPHCTGCYERRNCRHWMLPALSGGGAVVSAGVTKANAPAAVLLYMQLGEARERLMAMLEEHVNAEGPIPIGEDKQWGPTMSRGRKSASVEELERAGLHQYVKQGKPYRTFRISRSPQKRIAPSSEE